ncbi:MAG: hypothetical protein L0Y72_12470 [Gemmataceae bacterium]|nr:hypothetical protein [Gemmataceae bacterium]MCI0739852.1 hypothetical protein [Gemmataceae bacterium]
MNHIPLEKQHEAVQRFVLSLPQGPQGAIVELDGRAVAWVVAGVDANCNGDDGPWTKTKNDRRCDLIDRKHGGVKLTPAEAFELAQLQAQMLRYRQRVAPLPLEEARQLHQELLEKAARAQADA